MAEKLVGQLEMLRDEEKITEIETRLVGLQLSNKRLAYTATVARGSKTSAAMIEDIDSATIQKRRASFAWIIVGAILVLIGIAIGGQYYAREYGWVSLLIGIVMIALFFLLRRRIVQFTIAGTSWLSVPTRKLGSEAKIADFVNKFFEVKDSVSRS